MAGNLNGVANGNFGSPLDPPNPPTPDPGDDFGNPGHGHDPLNPTGAGVLPNPPTSPNDPLVAGSDLDLSDFFGNPLHGTGSLASQDAGAAQASADVGIVEIDNSWLLFHPHSLLL